MFTSVFIGDQEGFNPAMDILDYFGLDDGLDVTWYHAANSHEKLDEALETTMMIEGDITLRWAGHPNQVISHLLGTYTCQLNKSCAN